MLSIETLLIAGDDAWRWLEDDGFAREWKAIADADAAYTWFQEPHFCRAWYRTYRNSAQPLLMIGRASGAVRAVMPLARLSDGRLAHAGGHQCEYQGWVAGADTGVSFVIDSVRRLNGERTYTHWQWQYLSPGKPTEWLGEIQAGGMGGVIREQTQSPLLDVHDEGFIGQRIKGRLKSYINKLTRRGLRYDRPQDPARIEKILEHLARWYDIRQGAVRSTTPFTDDPFKLYFYRRLAADPTEVWLSVLETDDGPIAAHAGPFANGELNMNLPGQSLAESALSPGLILLVEMARDLRRSGGHTLDLSPGGEHHKSRFKTSERTLEGFTLYRSRTAALIAGAKLQQRQLAARLLRAAGLEPSRVAQSLRPLTGRGRKASGSPARIEFQLSPAPETPPEATCKMLDATAAEVALLEGSRRFGGRAALALLRDGEWLGSHGWRAVQLDCDGHSLPPVVWLQPAERVQFPPTWRTGDNDHSDAEKCVYAWGVFDDTQAARELAPMLISALIQAGNPAAQRLVLLLHRAF